jgi:hypothetical protein
MANQRYALPPEVGVGLTTGRTEFLTLLERQLAQNDRIIPREQIIDLIRLVKDMIEQQARDQERLTTLEKFIDSMDDFNKGIFSKLANMREAIRDIRRGDEQPAERRA